MPKTPFINPYELCKKDGTNVQVVFQVHKSDWAYVRTIRPHLGTLTTVCSVLWKKFTEKLKTEEIESFTDVEQFESLVMDCVLLSKDEYESLINDATQWQQQQASRGNLGGEKSSRRVGLHNRSSDRTPRKARASSDASNERRGTESIRAGSSPDASINPNLSSGSSSDGSGETNQNKETGIQGS